MTLTTGQRVEKQLQILEAMGFTWKYVVIQPAQYSHDTSNCEHSHTLGRFEISTRSVTTLGEKQAKVFAMELRQAAEVLEMLHQVNS